MHIGRLMGGCHTSSTCPLMVKALGSPGCQGIDPPGEPPHQQDALVGSSCEADDKTEFGDREVEHSSSRPVKAPLPVDAARGQQLEPSPAVFFTGRLMSSQQDFLLSTPHATPKDRMLPVLEWTMGR